MSCLLPERIHGAFVRGQRPFGCAASTSQVVVLGSVTSRGEASIALAFGCWLVSYITLAHSGLDSRKKRAALDIYCEGSQDSFDAFVRQIRRELRTHKALKSKASLSHSL